MYKSDKPIGLWSAVSMGIGAMVDAGIFALLGEASAISKLVVSVVAVGKRERNLVYETAIKRI